MSNLHQTSAPGEGDIVELYPSERNKLVEVWSGIQRKYLGKTNDLKTLMDLKQEAEQEFAVQMNLKVAVDVLNQELGDDGNFYVSPIITPIERLNTLEFDHDRMKQEVRSGELDGVAGVIDEKGNFKQE